MFKECVNKSLNDNPVSLAMNWPSQAVQCISMAAWTAAMERALPAGSTTDGEDELTRSNRAKSFKNGAGRRAPSRAVSAEDDDPHVDNNKARLREVLRGLDASLSDLRGELAKVDRGSGTYSTIGKQ